MGITRRLFVAGGIGAAGLAVAGAGWWGYGRWQLSRVEAPVMPWFAGQLRRFDAARPGTLVEDGQLVAALAGATVVGIGEATHGSHEDVACKAALVRALVQAGAIDTLLLEANGPGARDLDAFIQGADGDAAERLKAAKVFRILKTQDLADLLAWLRDWNLRSAAKVHIVGVDCQATPADAAFALDWLQGVDAAAAADFRARLMPFVSDEAQALHFPRLIGSLTTAQIRQGMADLEALRAVLAADGPHAGADGRLEAERSARVAWQGLHAFELEGSDGVQEGDLDAYYSRRDVSMADNILEASRAAAGGVYWAHNMHVAAAPLTEFGSTFVPTGHHLRQALGERYKAVLFEYAAARFIAVPMSLLDGGYPPSTDPTEVIDWGYTGGRLAAMFRAAGGGDAWIDLAARPDTPEATAWADHPYPMRTAGYAAVPSVHLMPAGELRPGPTIDVLVHVEQLTPARMLP